MTRDERTFLEGWLRILREAFEGGEPGHGGMFLDGTKPDGSGNSGLFATLAGMPAERASDASRTGTSAAAHAAHLAFYLESTVRWVEGDTSPRDWPASFEPRTVDEAGWTATQERVRKAYDGIVALARGAPHWNEDAAAGIAACLAHSAYHLGAIRQITKNP